MLLLLLHLQHLLKRRQQLRQQQHCPRWQHPEVDLLLQVAQLLLSLLLARVVCWQCLASRRARLLLLHLPHQLQPVLLQLQLCPDLKLPACLLLAPRRLRRQLLRRQPLTCAGAW